MKIPSICKSISSNLSHNLLLATSDDERHQYHSQALQEIGDKVIPALNRLPAEQGEGRPELDEARAAALELATIVCIGFVRNCTHFRWGISQLEEMSANCREPQLKKKLVIYTNQLKNKWNIAEPGGITHNPRARRVGQLPGESKTFANLLRITLLFGGALYFFTHIDLTSTIFPHWNEPRQPEQVQRVQVDRPQEAAVPTPQNNPAELKAEALSQPPERTVGSFYSYTDEKGVVHIVDDLDKVPNKFRKGMAVTTSSVPRNNVTPVVIKGNQVLVPVTLSHHGRSVEAMLLLDTGATITTINERLAALLGVAPAEMKQGTVRLADGRSVAAHGFVINGLAVGSKNLANLQASIIPGSGGEGHEGLLGMNFLKNFRYHVDFNRSVIEWGG